MYYLFTGKEKDSSGLYYYGARYYDPELGRFISADPILDGLNRYTYVHCNPIKYVDPFGLSKEHGWNVNGGTHESYKEHNNGHREKDNKDTGNTQTSKPAGGLSGNETIEGGENTETQWHPSSEDMQNDAFNPNSPNPYNQEIRYTSKRWLSNPETRQTVIDLGEELDADDIEVCGGDRTREEQKELFDNRDTTAPPGTSQHEKEQRHSAADVRYYDENGKQIDPSKVADKAKEIEKIGGVGVYDTFTHIDIRPRKSDGSVAWWDNRTNK